MDQIEWSALHAQKSDPSVCPSPLDSTLWRNHRIINSADLRTTFDGAIFHGEDKLASSLRIFLPMLVLPGHWKDLPR
jgi:hypothetical protein